MVNLASTILPFATDVTRPSLRPSGGVYKKCPTSKPDSLTPSLPTGHRTERGREGRNEGEREGTGSPGETTLEAGIVGTATSVSGNNHFISPCMIWPRPACTQREERGTKKHRPLEAGMRKTSKGTEPLIISSFLDVFVPLPLSLPSRVPPKSPY